MNEKVGKNIMILAGALAVVIAVVFWVALKQVFIPTSRYNSAVSMMSEGNYEEAISAFEELDGYKDSAEKIVECGLASQYDTAIALMELGKYDAAVAAFGALDGYKDSAERIEECKIAALRSAGVGDYVCFGSYEQDNDESNGQEDIEWLVLNISSNRMLLISKYALDCQPYNERRVTVTWETCTLREWLNEQFLNDAFSAGEQALIPTVTVSADDANLDSRSNADPGKDTQDKVFLLSIPEAEAYFVFNEARKCQPSDYATAGGGATVAEGGKCWWWLRTPGATGKSAACVGYGGEIRDIVTVNVNSEETAVRPAIWVDLNN